MKCPDYRLHKATRHINNQRLDFFATLEDDWDGCGSSKIPMSAVEQARELIMTVDPSNQPQVFPISGGVQVEWDSPIYHEVEVYGNNLYNIWIDSKDFTGYIAPIPFDSIQQLLKSLRGHLAFFARS